MDRHSVRYNKKTKKWEVVFKDFLTKKEQIIGQFKREKDAQELCDECNGEERYERRNS